MMWACREKEGKKKKNMFCSVTELYKLNAVDLKLLEVIIHSQIFGRDFSEVAPMNCSVMEFSKG